MPGSEIPAVGVPPTTATSKSIINFAPVRRVANRVFDVADPAEATTRSIAVIIWAAWTVLVAFLLITHDPWRDELQAWGLARASATPFDVIANLRHEGHPPTWYLLLWPFAKVFGSYVTLQVITFFVGTTATWITLRKMPVSLWLRAAIVFGYFPLFELGTISRSYSLAWLLTVTALWLANKPGTPNWLIALVIAALAGTTVLAIPLAIALAVGIWGGPWVASRSRGPLNLPWLSLFTIVPAAVVAVALPTTGGGPSIKLSRLSMATYWQSLASALRAAYPVTDRVDSFWGRFVVREWTTWSMILGIAIIIALAWSVRRSRTALTVWILSTFGFLTIIATSLLPLAPRIVSPLWMTAIAAIWFAAAERRTLPPESRKPLSVVTMAAITFLLVASLWASAWAVWIGTAIPFTTAGAAAEWIETQADGKDIVILCAIRTPFCSSVSIRLDAPAYTSADGKPFSFVEWNDGWSRTPKQGDIPAIAASLAKRTGAEVFVVAPINGFPLGCQNGLRPPPRAVTEYVLVCRADQLATLAN